MKGMIVPLVLALIGAGGGIGAGVFLKEPSTTTESDEEHGDEHTSDDSHDGTDSSEDHGTASDDHGGDHEGNETEFARLSNQFVVPILDDGEVTSLVVMSLSIEVTAGGQDIVFEREPRIRDAFLRTLFDHANMGGFDGNFTQSNTMDLLRRGLKTAARNVVGSDVLDVLIVDIVRQDI